MGRRLRHIQAWINLKVKSIRSKIDPKLVPMWLVCRGFCRFVVIFCGVSQKAIPRIQVSTLKAETNALHYKESEKEIFYFACFCVKDRSSPRQPGFFFFFLGAGNRCASRLALLGWTFGKCDFLTCLGFWRGLYCFISNISTQLKIRLYFSLSRLGFLINFLPFFLILVIWTSKSFGVRLVNFG